MSEVSPFIVFDLETQKIFEDIGNRENLRALGLAVAVIYDSRSEIYKTYTEEQAAGLINDLESAPLIVGFNLVRFDYEVLSAYTDRPLTGIPTLDIHEEVYRHTGIRLSLEDLTSATLGLEKSASGLLAVRWFKDGRLDLVMEYCRRDVEITKALYEYGRDHGQVFYWDRARGSRRTIPVFWSR